MRITIHLLAHVLTFVGAVAACIWLGLLAPSSRVMEVNSDALLQRFSQNQPERSKAEMSQDVKRYLGAMDQVLARLARENGVVIVDAKLAIAGAQDITDEAFARAMAIFAGAGVKDKAKAKDGAS